jgi:hypothetical protein
MVPGVGDGDDVGVGVDVGVVVGVGVGGAVMVPLKVTRPAVDTTDPLRVATYDCGPVAVSTSYAACSPVALPLAVDCSGTVRVYPGD